jgi:hypothetical protein
MQYFTKSSSRYIPLRIIRTDISIGCVLIPSISAYLILRLFWVFSIYVALFNFFGIFTKAWYKRPFAAIRGGYKKPDSIVSIQR